MPRNMSFFMTTRQMRDRTKTVTRRFGWKNIRSGEVINAVEKAQGLKKGEKMVRICQIRIISTRWEPLSNITQDECDREGFPHLSPLQFVLMLCDPKKRKPDVPVNRIEFEYMDGEVG